MSNAQTVLPPRAPVVPGFLRLSLRELTLGRILKGGRVNDLGRLPRYAGSILLGAAVIWAPIIGYMTTAPKSYTSGMSLILPGSGASASVNLDKIGQASSFANSPYANTSVSPTVTYKRLISADRIVARAAAALDLPQRAFGAPRVDLVDLTGLILVQVTGPTAEEAQARGNALLEAFFGELDALRSDELSTREIGGVGAISEYRESVAETRAEIERLQRESGLLSPDQYQALVVETDALRAHLKELQTNYAEQAQAVTALETALGIDAQLAAATLKLHTDSEFLALTEDMSRKSAKLAEAAGRYGPKHPVVTSAEADYRALQSTARVLGLRITGLSPDEIDRIDLAPIGGRANLLERLVQTDAERQGLKVECDATEARLAAKEAEVERLLKPAARLEDLQRDFKVAEAVFASAMARAESTKSDLYASYPLVQVLENPSLPDSPSSPKLKLAIAAGVAATLMLILGLVLGWMRRPLISRLLASPDAP